MAESELVLLIATTAQQAGSDTLLSPVWYYRFEPEILRSVTPEIVSVNGGDALVGIDECLNGTGGCAQNFFLRNSGSWRVVRLAFLDSLNRHFPGAIKHGYHVDVRTLRATTAVYSPTDANGCASRVAEMRLRNEALELVELHRRHEDSPS